MWSREFRICSREDFFNLAVEKFEKLEKIQITSRVLLFKYKFSF